MLKKIVAGILGLALSFSLVMPAAGASYHDVPSDSSLAAEVQKAVNYGLMNGYSSQSFGYADPITRAQFLTVVGRMLGWFDSSSTTASGFVTPSMKVDPPESGTAQSVSALYWSAINTAAELGVVDTDRPFRPNEAITRGEMAEVLVRALGLKQAAASMEKANVYLPFTDVTEGRGYVAIAYEIGMTNGTSSTTFSPQSHATRAQAAAMMVRIYEKLNQPTKWIHAFYAISSYQQIAYAQDMDAVSAGWSHMHWDGNSAKLKTDSSDGNDYAIPDGYETAVQTLGEYQTELKLQVYMDTSNGLKEMLASPTGREEAVTLIVEELTRTYPEIKQNPYSGVTIDFEGLRAESKENFTLFLQALASEVHALNKTVYVCVSPVLTTGAYYDGYDYRAIGKAADKVILMAHDYDARNLSGFEGSEYYKTTSAAPLDQVYMSLRAIVDPQTGVEDLSKIALAFSNKNIAWQIDENGKLLDPVPAYPSNETVYKRLNQVDTIHGWSANYQTCYAIYTNEAGERWYLLYEDSRTLQSKLNAAKLLGITGVSIWRLGTMPNYSDWNWSALLQK